MAFKEDVDVWLLDYAIKHNLVTPIQEIKKRNGGHLQLDGIPAIRLACSFAHHVILTENLDEFETVANFIEKVYRTIPDVLSFIRFGKVLMGLRMKIMMHHLKTPTMDLLGKLYKYFPVAGLKLENKVPKKHLERLNAALASFRNDFLPLSRDENKRKTYFRDGYRSEYGTRFMDSLKTLAVPLLAAIEAQLPLTVLEKILVDTDYPVGDPDMTVAMDILVDSVAGKTSLTEEDLMELIRRLNPDNIPKWRKRKQQLENGTEERNLKRKCLNEVDIDRGECKNEDMDVHVEVLYVEYLDSKDTCKINVNKTATSSACGKQNRNIEMDSEKHDERTNDEKADKRADNEMVIVDSNCQETELGPNIPGPIVNNVHDRNMKERVHSSSLSPGSSDFQHEYESFLEKFRAQQEQHGQDNSHPQSGQSSVQSSESVLLLADRSNPLCNSGSPNQVDLITSSSDLDLTPQFEGIRDNSGTDVGNNRQGEKQLASDDCIIVDSTNDSSGRQAEVDSHSSSESLVPPSPENQVPGKINIGIGCGSVSQRCLVQDKCLRAKGSNEREERTSPVLDGKCQKSEGFVECQDRTLSILDCNTNSCDKTFGEEDGNVSYVEADSDQSIVPPSIIGGDVQLTDLADEIDLEQLEEQLRPDQIIPCISRHLNNLNVKPCVVKLFRNKDLDLFDSNKLLMKIFD